MSALTERTLAYLHTHNVMTLATHGPEGLWAAAVFYVNVGFQLYFLSVPSTRHSQNIAAQPAVAVTIQEDYGDWLAVKGVQLEGVTRRIEGEERNQANRLYGKKFPVVGNLAKSPFEIVRAMRRVDWYKVEPVRLFFIDNSFGLGHREEVGI